MSMRKIDVPLKPVEPGDSTGLPTREPESYPDAMYRFLDDAVKRRAFGEFIPLPLFDAIMEMLNTLPNTKLNHRGYQDTYSVAAALDELRRLRPFPTD